MVVPLRMSGTVLFRVLSENVSVICCQRSLRCILFSLFCQFYLIRSRYGSIAVVKRVKKMRNRIISTLFMTLLLRVCDKLS